MDVVALNLTTETVERAMVRTLVTVTPDVPIRQALDRLNENRTGCLLAVDESGLLVGIFTERDALGLMARGDDLDQPVRTAMTSKPSTLRTHNTVGAAVQSMASGHYRRLPIVDEDGKPVGILKSSGIVHYLVEHFPEAVYNLPDPHTVDSQREGA